MTPENKDGRENYKPKPITSKLQLNHITLSTEISSTLMIFWFFPEWRKALRDNKSFKVSVEAAYLRNRICNAKSQSWSLTFTHCTFPQAAVEGCLSSCPLPPPEQVRDRDSHPGPQERAHVLSELREEQRCRAVTGELQVLWELLTRLHREVNLVKMLWTCSHSPRTALCQDWGQYMINWSLIIPTNIHF